MNDERRKEVIDIANSLSNDDLAMLISMVSDRLDVYIGNIGKYCISDRVLYASLNGAGVQVNLEHCELDDLREDRFIAKALGDIAKPDNVIEIGGPSDATH